MKAAVRLRFGCCSRRFSLHQQQVDNNAMFCRTLPSPTQRP